MAKAALLICSYILGSIPFGLFIVRAWKGIDIREYGSGNIGATNVLRTAGRGPAIVVFVADVLKGLTPVLAARLLFPHAEWIIVSAGLLAIVGHTLSVFLRFHGGKGVATSLGVIIGLAPVVAAIGFGLWVAVLILSKRVSPASMLAAASIPVLMFIFDKPLPYKSFGILAGAFVLIKHRWNMIRLWQGKEPRWNERVDIAEDSHG